MSLYHTVVSCSLNPMVGHMNMENHPTALWKEQNKETAFFGCVSNGNKLDDLIQSVILRGKH